MRPTIDEWAMSLAMVTAQRTTCLKRQVGAVLLDLRNHLLATGYNGVAAGLPHCNESVSTLVDMPKIRSYETMTLEAPIKVRTTYPHACEGAKMPMGSGGECQALHAEWNSLLQCHDVYKIATCYVTTAPCETCAKLLLGTTCGRIVFLDSHDDAAPAEALWRKAGRIWEKLEFTSFLRAHQGSYTGFLTRPLPA